jgi:hypothetical protein
MELSHQASHTGSITHVTILGTQIMSRCCGGQTNILPLSRIEQGSCSPSLYLLNYLCSFRSFVLQAQARWANCELVQRVLSSAPL